MAATVEEKYGAIDGATFVPDPTKPTIFSMSVEGLEGSGKTHFALLTAPLPIVHVNFGDRSAEWFLYQMDEERRKHVTLYSFQASSSQGWTAQEGRDSLVGLSEIAQHHLANGAMAGGTFILDSGSTWWEVVQEVYVAPEQMKREGSGGKRTGGLEYMQGNLIVSGVLSWIKNQGAFTMITHRKKQVWRNAQPVPGMFEAQINKKVPYLVEVRLDIYKTCAVCGSEECQAKGHQGRKHWGRFLKFAANTNMEGFAWENPTFDFVYSMYAGRPL
mgnify:FL=1